MTELNHAEASPRVCEDLCIRWYEGNTAFIEMEIELYEIGEDETETALPIQPDDVIRVRFRDFRGKEIYEFSFTNIQNNTIEIGITREISKLFKKGLYTYCVYLDSAYVDTTRNLVCRNAVEVE